MKIYLVSGDEYEQRYIAAAFTSKEEAEKFAVKESVKYKQKNRYESNFYRLAEEVELDGVNVKA